MLISSCFHPPYNNFRTDHRAARAAAGGTAFGAAAGGLTGGTLTGALIGGAVGGTIGAVIGIHKDSKPKLIKDLSKQNIEFVEYGDTMTLIVPTDKYFMFESPRLNEIMLPGFKQHCKTSKALSTKPYLCCWIYR